MIISQLESALKAIREKHGDLPVSIYGNNSFYFISETDILLFPASDNKRECMICVISAELSEDETGLEIVKYCESGSAGGAL